MNIKEALKIIPARVESVWHEYTGEYIELYRPGEDNPYGAWLNEAQYLNIAKAKRVRMERQQHDS